MHENMETDEAQVLVLEHKLLKAQKEWLDKVSSIKKDLSEEEFKKFGNTMKMLRDFDEELQHLEQIVKQMYEDLYT